MISENIGKDRRRRTMKPLVPQRPENLDPIAENMLDRLRQAPEASNIVIGGGVALNCYAPPRLTRDIDAWWSRGTSAAERASTLQRLREIATEVGKPGGLAVWERPPSASEVVSIELQANRRTVFAFQIAPRDVELEPPFVAESPFSPVAVEALADNLGAKMTALVARGAPRDFQDVYNVVQAGIAVPDELWALFERKNLGHDIAVAKAQVLQRLGEIQLRRPLETIEPESRAAAAALRAWVCGDLAGRPFEQQAPNRDIHEAPEPPKRNRGRRR
jgi:hypothetical protein